MHEVVPSSVEEHREEEEDEEEIPLFVLAVYAAGAHDPEKRGTCR